ncbi:MAG: tRNA (adenosine(37)-N6)-dimethylallyltransferase MiaA [Chitinophagales bacterium]
MSKLLITILGPTASGKTALAIELAKYFNTEILSADSRQFYKEMSIGTAKPTEQELAEVKHHFINTHSVTDTYTAGQYEDDALAVLDKIFAEKDVAIMVGGSGLYINAVLYGIDPFPDIPMEVRKNVLRFYKENGLQALRDELRKLDPEYFLEVDLDNPRRLMRAVEVCRATGEPYSSFRKQKPKKRDFQSIEIAYSWERETLYDRINERVDTMLATGLIEEAIALEKHKDLPALDTIGYKELFAHFGGEYDLDRAAELIKRNSRRYAKRQMTWFRSVASIAWFKPETSIESFYQYIQNKLGS